MSENSPIEGISLPPDDVMQAIEARDPERLYTVCARHYQPEAVAMWTGNPGRGAAIVGFLPKLGGKQTIMNAFCSVYYDIDTSKQVTVYMGLDDLVKINFTCISGSLARALHVASPEAGKRAEAQVSGVSDVLAAARLLRSAGRPSAS